MCLLNNKHDASLRVLGPMLHTNFHCHLSTSAAAAAIGALMLPLADAANSSISAFSLCITHSMASRPLKSAMHSVLLTAKVWPCLGCVCVGGTKPQGQISFPCCLSLFRFYLPNTKSLEQLAWSRNQFYFVRRRCSQNHVQLSGRVSVVKSLFFLYQHCKSIIYTPCDLVLDTPPLPQPLAVFLAVVLQFLEEWRNTSCFLPKGLYMCSNPPLECSFWILRVPRPSLITLGKNIN